MFFGIELGFSVLMWFYWRCKFFMLIMVLFCCGFKFDILLLFRIIVFRFGIFYIMLGIVLKLIFESFRVVIDFLNGVNRVERFKEFYWFKF